MLEKLSLALKSQRAWLLPLALKTILFSVFLALGSLFSGIFYVLALGLALFCYFRPFLNAGRFLASFVILLWLSLLLPANLSFVGGILFFLILSAKEMVFARYDAVYYSLHGGLVFAVAIHFFKELADLDLWVLSFSGIALFFLIREIALWMKKEEGDYFLMAPIKLSLTALGLVFFAIQSFWVIRLFPFTILNSALIGLFSLLAAEDFFFRFTKGVLTRRVVLRSITAIILLFVGIVGMTGWQP